MKVQIEVHVLGHVDVQVVVRKCVCMLHTLMIAV
jgi:hypothetical protein